MNSDVGIPVLWIPARVLDKLALHLDTGTENTWECLAECMGLHAGNITVCYYFYN